MSKLNVYLVECVVCYSARMSTESVYHSDLVRAESPDLAEKLVTKQYQDLYEEDLIDFEIIGSPVDIISLCEDVKENEVSNIATLNVYEI